MTRSEALEQLVVDGATLADGCLRIGALKLWNNGFAIHPRGGIEIREHRSPEAMTRLFVDAVRFARRYDRSSVDTLATWIERDVFGS